MQSSLSTAQCKIGNTKRSGPVTLCLEGRGTGYVGCGDWLVHDQKATSRLKSGTGRYSFMGMMPRMDLVCHSLDSDKSSTAQGGRGKLNSGWGSVGLNRRFCRLLAD